MLSEKKIRTGTSPNLRKEDDSLIPHCVSCPSCFGGALPRDSAPAFRGSQGAKDSLGHGTVKLDSTSSVISAGVCRYHTPHRQRSTDSSPGHDQNNASDWLKGHRHHQVWTCGQWSD